MLFKIEVFSVDEMAQFSTQEYTDMVIMYGVAGESARAAARLYAERFPKRERHPDSNVILRCIHRLRETGSVLPNRHHVGARMQVGVNNEEKILRAFENNPNNSVRRVAHELGLSRYVVHRTLRDYELHPDH